MAVLLRPRPGAAGPLRTCAPSTTRCGGGWSSPASCGDLTDRPALGPGWSAMAAVGPGANARAGGASCLEVIDPSGRGLRPPTASTPASTAPPARASSGATADLRLDVADLGAAYLGGVSFSLLAAGGRVEEHTPAPPPPTPCSVHRPRPLLRHHVLTLDDRRRSRVWVRADVGPCPEPSFLQQARVQWGPALRRRVGGRPAWCDRGRQPSP